MMENNELNIRISMCRFCIKVLEDGGDDPRQPDALEHYRKQLAYLEAQTKSGYNEIIPRPPDIVVNLKPAQLSTISPK